jgi:hypothetical protein
MDIRSKEIRKIFFQEKRKKYLLQKEEGREGT